VLFTHTHSSPETERANDLVRAYRQVLHANLLHVAKEALDNLRPCTVAWGVTSARIGVNRREHHPDGTARMGTNPAGPVDERVGVLRIDDAQTSVPLGLLVICTAHANVLKMDSTVISADFPGWTRRLLQQVVSCPVMVAIGAAGNINARWRGAVSDLIRMSYGLAGPVLALLPELTPATLSQLWIDSRIMPMRLLDVPAPEVAQALATKAEHEWEVQTRAWLDTMDTLHHKGMRQLSLDLEIQVLRINDGMFAGIPMEPFAETALELQARTASPTTFLGGYTNGYYGYLPTAEEFRYGGYEVEWMPVAYGPITGLLRPAQPDTASRVVDAVVELWKQSQHTD
jgi:hypothetical protein